MKIKYYNGSRISGIELMIGTAMPRLRIEWILAITLLLASSFCYAMQFQNYTKTIRKLDLDETERDTLLSIMNACGQAKNLDDDCAIQELDRVATEESNEHAKIMLRDYDAAIREGNGMDLECQTDNHTQVNRTLGHCVLLLNFYAIEEKQSENALQQYEVCLQGGMLGLAYQGNLAAQFVLTQLFNEKDMPDSATTWQHALNQQKESDEYMLLMKCYRS